MRDVTNCQKSLPVWPKYFLTIPSQNGIDTALLRNFLSVLREGPLFNCTNNVFTINRLLLEMIILTSCSQFMFNLIFTSPDNGQLRSDWNQLGVEHTFSFVGILFLLLLICKLTFCSVPVLSILYHFEYYHHSVHKFRLWCRTTLTISFSF